MAYPKLVRSKKGLKKAVKKAVGRAIKGAVKAASKSKGSNTLSRPKTKLSISGKIKLKDRKTARQKKKIAKWKKDGKA